LKTNQKISAPTAESHPISPRKNKTHQKDLKAQSSSFKFNLHPLATALKAFEDLINQVGQIVLYEFLCAHSRVPLNKGVDCAIQQSQGLVFLVERVDYGVCQTVQIALRANLSSPSPFARHIFTSATRLH
jgi:hypothetical protein